MTITLKMIAMIVFLSIYNSNGSNSSCLERWNRNSADEKKWNYFPFDLSNKEVKSDSSKEKEETFPGYTMRA